MKSASNQTHEALTEENAVSRENTVPEKKKSMLGKAVDEGKSIVSDELNRAKKQAVRQAKGQLKRSIRGAISSLLKG
ncbi:MAG: hypothetical protein PQJ50_07485 [Spirochaetales bacterium]|nr:hypothetical protein [Spirochaetales bacterium]